MNPKITYLLTTLMLLVGCDAHTPASLSFNDVRNELKANNRVLDGHTKMDDIITLPFSEAYLARRHHLYGSVAVDVLTQAQQQELEFLQIQERYPERFLPWPVQVNMLENLGTNNEKLAAWSHLVQTRLQQAIDSKIYLSRYERDRLLRYITTTTPQVGSIVSLETYLDTYKPRTALGLYQLPNGKEWYQSKLNYYYGLTKAPSKTLNVVQQALASQGKKSSIDIDDSNGRHFTLHYLQAHCQLINGLNWIDSYINLPETARHCAFSIKPDTKHLILALMEIDLGIHYQGWSHKQASVTLQARIKLVDEQTAALIESVLLYPGSIFSLANIAGFNSL
ncbi:hypothetical protein [Pseudoalteromonas sp. MMG012]|uniref:hypothetical protein n=1 Tax=Pseudoalteromonas sp. MMG012 TaxID=2822686 RepID=UPI001B3A387B|nr:hypothetical protein [Pseudoalteromonas sp. MMG012]MBQ4849509.1 hypothetical protein [Pseudoalteromonas sp. MMG012]